MKINKVVGAVLIVQLISLWGCDFGLDAPSEDANGIKLEILSNVKVEGSFLLINGDNAYIFYSSSLQVFDISDRSNPELSTFIYLSTSINDAKISGSYIYAVGSYRLMIINKSSLEIMSTLKLNDYIDDYAEHIAIDGNYAYICAGTTLLIIDISLPDKPVLINTISLSVLSNCVVKNGIGYLLVWDDIKVYDFSEPLNPLKCFEIDCPYSNNVTTFTKNGEYLYVINQNYYDERWYIGVMKLITPKQLEYIRGSGFPEGIVSLDFDKYGVASDGTTIYLLNIVDPSYPCVSEKIAWESSFLKTYGDYIYSLGGGDFTILKVQRER